jgi:hypothetical protein
MKLLKKRTATWKYLTCGEEVGRGGNYAKDKRED